MSDKEKEVQLKEEEAEKVSGGASAIYGTRGAKRTQLLTSDEESDQEDKEGLAGIL